mgnify:CR=1 FL=1
MKLFLAALVLCASPLMGADEEPSTAMKLMEVMEYERTADEAALKAFKLMIGQLEAQGIPKAAVEEITVAAQDMMRRSFIDGKVVDKVAALYEERFTEDELIDLIAFYKTPLGRKILAEQSGIMEEGMKIGMEAVEKNQAKFQQDVGAIIEKHLAADAEEPAPEE